MKLVAVTLQMEIKVSLSVSRIFPSPPLDFVVIIKKLRDFPLTRDWVLTEDELTFSDTSVALRMMRSQFPRIDQVYLLFNQFLHSLSLCV